MFVKIPQKSGQEIIVNKNHVVTVADVQGSTVLQLVIKDSKGNPVLLTASLTVDAVMKLLNG